MSDQNKSNGIWGGVSTVIGIIVLVFLWTNVVGPWLKQKAEHSREQLLPYVPVSVSTRDGMSGKVAILVNRHFATLSVLATFRNASFQEVKSYKLVLQPNEQTEIGWMEGWKVVAGETIELSSDGFRTVTLKF